MTSPYIYSDQATNAIVDILSSPSDAHDAMLAPASTPAPTSTSTEAPPPGAIAWHPAYAYSPHDPPTAGTGTPLPNSGPPAPPSPGYAHSNLSGSAYGVYKPYTATTVAHNPPGQNAPLQNPPGQPTAYGVARSNGTPSPSASSATPSAPPGPYVFPAKQPKPGENRILKPLGSHYTAENNAALNEMEKRDMLKMPKSSNPVVRYLNDQKREKYKIEVGTVMKRRGVPFDTAKVKEKYLRNGKAGGYQMPYVTPEQNRDWGLKGLIWVCVGDPKGAGKAQFFSHVGKPGRFHHSSFNRGGGVIGAGEWIVENGALIKVSANSGHYQPTIDFLYHAVLQLAVAFRDQVTTGGTTVFLFDKTTFTWVDYPVKEFIKSPTAGGRYTTHPSVM